MVESVHINHFSNKDIQSFNDFQGFLRFKFTWPYRKFLNEPAKFILWITGNQFGKTGTVSHSYVMRIMGWHPVAKKNVLYFECDEGHAYAPFQVDFAHPNCPQCGHPLNPHERGSRVFRFAAETLPGQSQNVDENGRSAEVKNTQYPEFKKWLPTSLLKKDITARNTSIIVADPYGGSDIIVEFVSYNQGVQGQAGVQRMSVWCDESPPPDLFQEQLPRLIAEDGDIVLTYTPIDKSSWLFDSYYEKARKYYRTKAITNFLEKTKKEPVPQVEGTDSELDIVVIQAATDDNPTLKVEAINALLGVNIDDPDDLAIRRYGIFKQLSGRIFKEFDYRIHSIQWGEYFPEGIPNDWTHARGIDYHPQTDWHCGMASLSPQNEMFIWGELRISPERYTTREITHSLAVLCKDYKFRLNLIDPLSEAIKKDTVSIKDDLNNDMLHLKKEGVGTGGYFQSWDTKGERGRDAVRERLKNSKLCKRPFNNKVVNEDGNTVYLPTLWVLNTCRVSADYLKNWRWEEWSDAKSATTKDKKNTPEQKFSHMNMVWEAILKEPSFKPPVNNEWEDRNYTYFRRR